MKSWFLALALLFPQFAYAANASVAIAVDYTPNAPAVRLQMKADYVAIPVTIQNDMKDPVKRTDEIERAFHLITEKVKQPDLKVRTGMVSLSPQEKSGFSKLSYDSHGQLYILGALKQEETVFEITKRIYQVIDTIRFANGTKVTLGNSTLGMDDPEKYRPQLLGLIASSIDGTMKSLNMNGSCEVSGLESAVAVMQLNEREVLVFLNYKLQIQTKPL